VGRTGPNTGTRQGGSRVSWLERPHGKVDTRSHYPSPRGFTSISLIIASRHRSLESLNPPHPLRAVMRWPDLVWSCHADVAQSCRRH
jgi:hypothetical protein